jgi:DNA-binding transcriptional ArsR family regulator
LRRDIFQAIADPTRREIVRIVAHKNINLNAVAEHFEISRPAISRHIKILTECGLILMRQEGRDRYCVANLSKLNEVNQWLEPYRNFLTSKLTVMEQLPGNNKSRTKILSKKIS